MNMFAKLALIAALGALSIPGVAAAQEAPDANVASQTGQGNMISQNGSEYTPLSNGEAVGPGDAIMVAPNSSVVLTVSDGTRSWQVTLPPGTYRITPGLLRTASGAPIASQTTGNLTFTVGAILGTVGLAAAGLSSMDEVPPLNPVSK